MKKFLALMTAGLLVVGCFGMTAFAAGTESSYTVKASASEVTVGDTVEVTVAVDDCSESGIKNVEFVVDLPEGLTFVDGSSKAASFGSSLLGLTMNEDNLKVSAMGGDVYKGAAATLITFKCTADKAGEYTIGLTGAYLTDASYSDYPAAVTTTKVVVAEKAVTPDTPDKPDAPVVPDTPDEPDTPVVPDTPVEPEKPDAPSADEGTSPPTGDNSAMAGIAVVCVAAVAGVVIARKRMMA